MTADILEAIYPCKGEKEDSRADGSEIHLQSEEAVYKSQKQKSKGQMVHGQASLYNRAMVKFSLVG